MPTADCAKQVEGLSSRYCRYTPLLLSLLRAVGVALAGARLYVFAIIEHATRRSRVVADEIIGTHKGPTPHDGLPEPCSLIVSLAYQVERKPLSVPGVLLHRETTWDGRTAVAAA